MKGLIPQWPRRRLLQTLGAGAVVSASSLRLGWAAPERAAGGRGEADGNRLVVVLLRGALDGLAAVPPVGDPAYAAWRPQSAADTERFGVPLPLAGPFALHPALSTLHAWFVEGRLLIAHAVASPYRDRSHFDAQQLLESGGNRPFELNTGWLGRALQTTRREGVAMGAALPLALRGADGATSWAPSGEALPEPEWLDRVTRLYANDTRLAAAFGLARKQREGAMDAAEFGAARDPGARRPAPGSFVTLAEQAGRMLAAEQGPAMAWLEMNGWDTHTQQAARLGRLLGQLDSGLAALRRALGERWARTGVLVMTEFGRSVAFNGSGGTDHGTASVAFLAGGAVAGGRVIGDWPGLAPAQLFQGRDLRPTHDVRTLMRPLLQRQLGLSEVAIGRDVLAGAPAGRTDIWRA